MSARRDDFGLKLALLSNQWQGVVRRAQQRRGIIDALACQWQRYTELSDKLRHWLEEAALEPEEEPHQHQHGRVTALQQARGVLDHIQVKNITLHHLCMVFLWPVIWLLPRTNQY